MVLNAFTRSDHWVTIVNTPLILGVYILDVCKSEVLTYLIKKPIPIHRIMSAKEKTGVGITGLTLFLTVVTEYHFFSLLPVPIVIALSLLFLSMILWSQIPETVGRFSMTFGLALAAIGVIGLVIGLFLHFSYPNLLSNQEKIVVEDNFRTPSITPSTSVSLGDMNNNHGTIQVLVNSSSTTIPQPKLANIRIASQKQIASTNPNFPYGLEVVIQTDVAISPVAFLFKFTGNVGDGNAMPIGLFEQFMQGVPPGMPDAFFAEWSRPDFIPETPIIVRVYSKNYIEMKTFERRQHIFPLIANQVPPPM